MYKFIITALWSMLFLVVPKCQVKKILVSRQEDFNQKWKQGFLC